MLYTFDQYSDVLISVMSSQITSLTIVYSTFYSGTNQRKHKRSESLAFVRAIHRRPVNSLHKGPVSRKMFPFDDVVMDDPRSRMTRYNLRYNQHRVKHWSNLSVGGFRKVLGVIHRDFSDVQWSFREDWIRNLFVSDFTNMFSNKCCLVCEYIGKFNLCINLARRFFGSNSHRC